MEIRTFHDRRLVPSRAMISGGRTVSELGENELLTRIAARLHSDGNWLGDDAAAVPAPSKNLLLAVDTVVEGIDFDLAYASGEDIGWKAIAVNVSDMAAMAGDPVYALASLTLRDDTPLDVFDGIIDGVSAACTAFDLEIVGGDLSGGSDIALSVSLLGTAGPNGVIKRSTARVGHTICVSGTLGAAAGGLEVLRRGLHPAPSATDHAEAFERLALRQLRPRPNVAAAKVLAGCGASAMIDISDGLAIDLDRLVRASQTGCSISSSSLPIDPDVVILGDALTVTVFDPMRAALLGGEDFEILCTVEAEAFEEARRAVRAKGSSLTSIGVVTEEGTTIDETPLDAWKEEAWEHLRSR